MGHSAQCDPHLSPGLVQGSVHPREGSSGQTVWGLEGSMRRDSYLWPRDVSKVPRASTDRHSRTLVKAVKTDLIQYVSVGTKLSSIPDLRSMGG